VTRLKSLPVDLGENRQPVVISCHVAAFTCRDDDEPLVAVMPAPQKSTGGADATRGLIVQALAAMLDLLDPKNDILEITLEPRMEHNQFDFFWKSSSSTCAKQVKSSVNAFQKAKVKSLARKIKERSPDAQCSLVLIGPVSRGLQHDSVVEGVKLELHTLNLANLVEQAAHRLDKFLEHQKLPSGNSSYRELLVRCLESKLFDLSATSSAISREQLAAQMREWISSTGSQLSIVLRVSPEDAKRRIQERIDCGNNISADLSRLHERVKWSTCFGEPRPSDRKEHGRLNDESWIWHESNQELIQNVLFASNSPYVTYMEQIQPEPPYGVFTAQIQLTQNVLNERITRLRSIIEKISLYTQRSEPSEARHRVDSR